MADLTLKKIGDLLGKKLKPISAKLDSHDGQFKSIHAKLDEHDNQFKSIRTKLDSHDGQFKSIRTKLDEHSEKLDSLTLDMIMVQKKTYLLPDLHSLIKDTKVKVDELEERVERLETAA